jgi:hypothetical protein
MILEENGGRGWYIWCHNKLPGRHTLHRCCYCQMPTPPYGGREQAAIASMKSY